MFVHKTIFVFSVLVVLKVYGKVTDEEYTSIPSIFYMDDFDKCMFLGSNALYCDVTVQLEPVDSKNYSETWRILSEIASNPKNYRHDILRHWICVPQSCSELSKNLSLYKQDYELLKPEISKCYSNKYKDMGLKGTVTQMHCETDQPFYSIDIYDVSVGLFLVILFVFVVFASLYEGRARYKTKEEYDEITTTKFGKIISCFSIPKNWKRLASTNTSPDANKLKCINGMRFYNMIMVITTHACMVSTVGPILNTKFTENITKDPINMILLNGNIAIQTYLVMAGMLLSYHFLLIMEKEKDVKFSYLFLAFINRYIRLTPALIVVIAINGTWLYHLSRGPLWDRVIGEEYRNCRENWWANLLYINNYYKSKKMSLLFTLLMLIMQRDN